MFISQAPHAVLSLLNSELTHHFSACRPTSYEILLLSLLTYRLVCDIATFLILSLSDENEPHDRKVIMSHFVIPSLALWHTSLMNPDLILFVNRLSSKNEKGTFQTGYSITTQYELLERGNLPQAKSAHPAELYTLTWACQLSEEQTIDIIFIFFLFF